MQYKTGQRRTKDLSTDVIKSFNQDNQTYEHILFFHFRLKFYVAKEMLLQFRDARLTPIWLLSVVTQQ